MDCRRQDLKGRKKPPQKKFFGKVFAIEKLIEPASIGADQTRLRGIMSTASADDSPDGWWWPGQMMDVGIGSAFSKVSLLARHFSAKLK